MFLITVSAGSSALALPHLIIEFEAIETTACFDYYILAQFNITNLSQDAE